jgi:hypothetical protein
MGALLSWINRADRGTVSATSATGLPASGLLTPQINDVWRSTGWSSTTVTVSAALGASWPINVVALAAPRDGVLPVGACTIRITASTTTAGASDALDTGSLPFSLSPWGVWAWRSVAGVTAQHWTIAMTSVSVIPYLQLGRLWIGPALITSRGYAFGATRGGRDPGGTARASLTGTRYARLGRTYRVERMTLPALTSAEATQVEAMSVAVGTTGQVFAARSDASLGDGIFGAFVEPPAVVRPFPQVWTADMQIEEDA